MPKISATPRQLLLLLLAGGALLYAPSLSYQFVYDDAIQIVSNPRITSWTHAPSYFAQQLWAGVQSASYYRPLLLLWFRLNHALFGFNPVAWHTALIALHLGATALAFLLARRLLQDSPSALIATAIFFFHPVQVESAAWPSAANEPLAAIFLLASYLFFLKSRSEPSANRNLLLSWLMFVLALLTKETAIVVPLMIFVLAWSYPKRSESAPRWSSALAAEVPFAIIVGLYLVMRKLVLAQAAPTTLRTDLTTSLLTIPSIVWRYISHMVVPVRLALIYDLPPVTLAGNPLFWIPALAVVLLIVIALWGWRRTRLQVLAIALLWIPIHLAVAVLTVPLFRNSDFAHDRYLYVPLLGFALLLAYGWRNLSSAKLRTVLPTFLLAFYAISSFHQQAFWSDDAALFARAYQVSPGAYLAEVLQAQQLAHEKKYAQALPILERAVSNRPDNPTGFLILANTRCEMNDVAAAQSLFASVLRRDPQSAEAHYLLGRCQLSHGQTAAAIPALQQAVSLFDSNLEYRLTLASALVTAARKDEAVEQYKAAEQLAPETERAALRDYIRRLAKP